MRTALLSCGLFLPALLLASCGGDGTAATASVSSSSLSSAVSSIVAFQPVASGAIQGRAPRVRAQLPVNVPILMYHYIKPLPPPEDVEGTDLTVTPETFASHLDWLAEHGYETINFADIVSGRTLPPKPVILTFDDGYEDAYTTVAPMLNTRGMTGVFYIVTSFIGKPGYLDWDQLTAMHAGGMELGAHSLWHANLHKLESSLHEKQILPSIETLQNNFEINVDSFAYPFGKYKDQDVEILKFASVPFAVTTEHRIAEPTDDPLLLPRLRIKNRSRIETMLEP